MICKANLMKLGIGEESSSILDFCCTAAHIRCGNSMPFEWSRKRGEGLFAQFFRMFPMLLLLDHIWPLPILKIFTYFLRFWDLKLQCLMRLAVTGNGDREVDLHTLAILQRLCAPTANFESNMVANDVDPLSLRPPPGYDVDTLTEEEQMTTRPILTRPPDPGVVTVQDNTIGAVVPAFASTEDRMESQRTATVRVRILCLT